MAIQTLLSEVEIVLNKMRNEGLFSAGEAFREDEEHSVKWMGPGRRASAWSGTHVLWTEPLLFFILVFSCLYDTI